MDELNSFFIKCKHLWKSGQDAHLDMGCHAGQAWVGIRVQLGHEAGVQLPKNRNRNTPSRQRRRARRAAARGEQEQHEEEVVAEEAHKTEAQNEAVEADNITFKLQDEVCTDAEYFRKEQKEFTEKVTE